MALSQEDKYRIIFALCHEGKILVEGSTSYSKILADRLENLNSFIEDRAISLVDSIESMKTKLETGSLKDNVKRIGDIELDTQKSMSLKHNELKRLLTELSQLLDIPNRCKVGGGGVGCLIL